jgi:hypothetical protein
MIKHPRIHGVNNGETRIHNPSRSPGHPPLYGFFPKHSVGPVSRCRLATEHDTAKTHEPIRARGTWHDAPRQRADPVFIVLLAHRQSNPSILLSRKNVSRCSDPQSIVLPVHHLTTPAPLTSACPPSSPSTTQYSTHPEHQRTLTPTTCGASAPGC